jgi:tetratricopeptide (TPR) repeat protein
MKTKISILAIFCFLISCKQTNDQLFDKAYALTKEKRYNKAIEIYNQLIKRNRKLQLAYYNRGFCYMDTKQYSKASADFNEVMDLQTNGDYIVTFNKDLPYASDEVKAQVPYNDALYERAQAKYYSDSLKSSFIDFQALVDNNYEEKTNCIIWQGTILVRFRKNEKACEYFEKARSLATNQNDIQEADRFINQYCSKSNNH